MFDSSFVSYCTERVCYESTRIHANRHMRMNGLDFWRFKIRTLVVCLVFDNVSNYSMHADVIPVMRNGLLHIVPNGECSADCILACIEFFRYFSRNTESIRRLLTLIHGVSSTTNARRYIHSVLLPALSRIMRKRLPYVRKDEMHRLSPYRKLLGLT